MTFLSSFGSRQTLIIGRGFLEVWTKRMVCVEDHENLNTLLGNEGFFQSNPFACKCASINEENLRYEVKDRSSQKQSAAGCPASSSNTPLPDPCAPRSLTCFNSRRDFAWTLKDDGTVETDGFVTCQAGRAPEVEGAGKGPEQMRHIAAPNVESRWLTPPGHNDARGEAAAQATRKENTRP